MNGFEIKEKKNNENEKAEMMKNKNIMNEMYIKMKYRDEIRKERITDLKKWKWKIKFQTKR